MARPDTPPTVRATHRICPIPVRHLVDAASHRGHACDPARAALDGVPDAGLSFDSRLPEDVLLPTLDALGEADPEVALVAARSRGPGHFSPLYHLGHAGETVADLLDICCRYMPLIWSRMEMHAELGATEAVLAGPAVGTSAGALLLQRYLVADMCWVAPQAHAVTPFRIRRVTLPGPRLVRASAWEPFAEQVQYGGARFEIACDRAALDIPLRAPNPDLASFFELRLERALAAHEPVHTARAAVRAVVRRHLRSGIDRGRVAAQIGWSERTLARRLAAEDRTFQQVVDEVRFESASTWLRSLTVNAVAMRLGFADVRSFQRAFRRWTGQTPTAWRRELA